jgi:hypothetical protein
LLGPRYFAVVSLAMVESECIIPMLSDIPGAIAEVSAPEAVPFFSQLASARTAAISRIVFIVISLKGRWVEWS